MMHWSVFVEVGDAFEHDGSAEFRVLVRQGKGQRQRLLGGRSSVRGVKVWDQSQYEATQNCGSQSR